MKIVRLVAFLLVISVANTLAAQADVPCAVTVPNELVPGSHGNAQLQVLGLWPNGTVVFSPGGPGFVTSDGGLGMKFGWMRHAAGKLRATGRRLDGAAAPLRLEARGGYGDTGFQASYLIFSTPGCWEVTAQVGDREDSRIVFVTKVEKIGEGPSWRRDPGR